jgi:hypothetical protein
LKMVRRLAGVGWLLVCLACRTSEAPPTAAQSARSGLDAAQAPSSAPSREFQCVQLEDQIKAQFEAFLSRHRACKNADDCTLAKTDCPLGCYGVPVSRSAQRQAKTVSDGLLALFEGQDCGCVYKCNAPEWAECRNGRCVAHVPAWAPGQQEMR